MERCLCGAEDCTLCYGPDADSDDRSERELADELEADADRCYERDLGDDREYDIYDF